jgi:parvulin-like peptidyl-prolyl isomerase
MMAEELGRIHMLQTEAVSRADFSPEKLLQKLINNRLIVQEAEAVGLADDSAVTGAVLQYRENLAYRVLMHESLPDTFTVSDNDLQQAFARHYERFDVRFLCVPDSAEATRLLDSIRHGAPMDQLARAVSVDKYKDNGGLSTEHVLRTLPVDLRSQFAASKPGDIIGPAPLWRVWATFRVEARHPADPSVLDSVKADVSALVLEEKRNTFREQYLSQLRAYLPVNVDTVQVDSIITRMLLGVDDPPFLAVTIAASRGMLLSDLRSRYIHRASGRNDRLPKAVLHEVLDEQIAVLLLKEAASRQEYVSRSQFDAPAHAFRDSILIVSYLEDVVAPTVKITDQDVADFYEANKLHYHAPNQYKIASITRATEDQARSDYVATTTGTDFAWLARQNSIDQYKEKGGERNWLDVSVFPQEILAELDSLPIGGVTRPTKVDEGFIVMRVLDRKAGATLPLDKVKDRIRSALITQRQTLAIDESIKTLRAGASIHIDEKTLQSLQISGPADASE